MTTSQQLPTIAVGRLFTPADVTRPPSPATSTCTAAATAPSTVGRRWTGRLLAGGRALARLVGRVALVGGRQVELGRHALDRYPHEARSPRG